MKCDMQRAARSPVAHITAVFGLAFLLSVDVAAAEGTVCTPIFSPRACYEKYLQTIQHATALRELHPFLTADRVQILEKGLATAKSAGRDPRQIEQVTLQLLQQASGPPDRIREQRFAREASLLVERPGVTVEVRLVIEAGGWRIADERFRQTPQV
jgi:hypothetical protein